jgi:drug/metabolite transporter (DMT)-like permease
MQPGWQPFKAIAMMCVGIACLSGNDAFGKALGADYPIVQVLFMRNLIALPFAIALVVWIDGPRALRSLRPAAHLVRGMLWLVAAMMFFTSLQFLPLAEATSLIFVAPIFITALSALVLKEHVGRQRWAAVLVGFVGVLIIVRPGGATFQAASLLPIVTALVYAVLMIAARWVDPRESVRTLMLYLVGASLLFASLIVPFVWVPVRAEHALQFLGIAVFGTAGITLMTQAFRMAPAAIVAPFDYTALIWATVLGFLFWGEMPDWLTFAGAAVIIASGGFIIWRESRQPA